MVMDDGCNVAYDEFGKGVPNYRRTPLDMASLITDGSLNPLLTVTSCYSGFRSNPPGSGEMGM